ncbi:MAG: GH116 family glycosyl-hydrolase [Chloroflexi bacterium]|nr:GH116 family glycosyl-hydrolase [Chloroflexota bacterium]
MDSGQPARLFPTNVPDRQWCRFDAAGFSTPVSGVIFRPARAPCCGMPLGGVATGCIDVDVRGVWGFSSLFNMLYPEKAFAGQRGNVFTAPLTRKTPAYLPMLGLALGDTTWVLASREVLDGGMLSVCADPVFVDRHATTCVPPLAGVLGAQEIHYWGHYPVVDIEYELEPVASSPPPLSVGLRAWSPFIPGDIEPSSAPCAFFELHLRNDTPSAQRGTLAFSFPGPIPPDTEGGLTYDGTASFHNPPPAWPAFPPAPARFTRRTFESGALQAVEVGDGSHSYVIGLMSPQEVRFGASLGRDGAAWTAIDHGLPEAGLKDPGASVAVPFALAAGEEQVLHLVLAWYAPEWLGAGDHRYTSMYARQFGSAIDVAVHMAPLRAGLLRRVLAWQQVIYAESQLPDWLQETLINNLALIPETTYWAVANPPLGDWCHQGGCFGMLESPRGCPQIECNPCTFYGNLPIVFFFPELARSQLEAYRRYQRADGAAPFVIGRWGPPDMATPGWDWQISLNGPVYAILVDRLWQRTGDAEVLHAFYQSVKRTMAFTMDLNPTPEGVISMPADNRGMEWFEWGEWLGMCSHLGAIRLAALRIVERMARALGDTPFEAQCRQWCAAGTAAMEEKLWVDADAGATAGGYYLNFYEEKTGRRSDAIMGYQLDGEWVANMHGVPGVFRADRVPVVLDTIRRCNMPAARCGALSFANADGRALSPDEKIVEYGSSFIFLPEIMMLAIPANASSALTIIRT